MDGYRVMSLNSLQLTLPRLLFELCSQLCSQLKTQVLHFEAKTERDDSVAVTVKNDEIDWITLDIKAEHANVLEVTEETWRCFLKELTGYVYYGDHPESLVPPDDPGQTLQQDCSTVTFNSDHNEVAYSTDKSIDPSISHPVSDLHAISFSPDVSENCISSTERENIPKSDTLQELDDRSSDSELVLTANVDVTLKVSESMDCDDKVVQSQHPTAFTVGCNKSDPSSVKTVEKEFGGEESVLIDKRKPLDNHISDVPQPQTGFYEHDAKLQDEASAATSVDQMLQPLFPSASRENVLRANPAPSSSCSSSRKAENFTSKLLNLKEEPDDFDVDQHITKLFINPATSIMRRQKIQVKEHDDNEVSSRPRLDDNRDEADVVEAKAFGSDIPKILRDVIIYVCYNCNKSFYDLDILRTHLVKHHKEIVDERKIRTGLVKDALICHLCNGIFKFFSHLQIHLKKAHNLVVYKQNKSTGELMMPPKQKRYRRISDPGVDAILCVICHRRFVNLAGYRIHVKIIHKDSSQYEAAMRHLELLRLKRTGRRSTLVLHCPLCLEECYGTRLFKHLTLAHADEPSLEAVKKEAETMFQREACRHWNKNDTRNRIVSCPMCERKMKKRVLGRHMSSECENDPNRANPESRIVTSPRRDQQLGKDDFCTNAKRCKNNAIERPMRSRTKATNNCHHPANEDKEVMDVDDSSGDEQELLGKEDVKIELPGESQCFLCKKVFKGYRGLNLHMMKIHRKESLKAPFGVQTGKPAKEQERNSEGPGQLTIAEGPGQLTIAEAGAPSYICDKCGASGKTCICFVGQAQDSNWTVSVFKCNTCSQQFDHPKIFKSHTCVPEVTPVKDTIKSNLSNVS